MNADTYIIGALARYSIQQGARFGGVANMCAVAHCIRNRVTAGWYGGNWMQVIEAAASVEGVDYSGDVWPVNLQSFTIRSFVQKVDEIYDGSDVDIFSGGRAVYFADLSAPHIIPWFVENIVRKPDDHPRVGTIQFVNLFA